LALKFRIAKKESSKERLSMRKLILEEGSLNETMKMQKFAKFGICKVSTIGDM